MKLINVLTHLSKEMRKKEMGNIKTAQNRHKPRLFTGLVASEHRRDNK